MKIVIMAGGQGTRFWPLSRTRKPKQFLPIVTERTMLQETVARVEKELPREDVFVVCGPRYGSEVLRQLPGLNRDQVILEPEPRNTAPCIAFSALHLKRRFADDEIMAILPADHVIEKTAEFHKALRAAGEAARQGWLVSFGIHPGFPATGYGYLEQGQLLGDFQGRAVYQVARFIEKPDEKRARSFLDSGRFFWNSGIFVWSICGLLKEFQSHLPGFFQTLLKIEKDWDNAGLVAEHFQGLEKTSIDFGLMEKSKRVAMIPCDLGWSDVGSWKAVHEVRSSTAGELTANTRCLALESSGNLVHSENGKLVALIGVKDLIVVETGDALLVCSRERSELVKEIVAKLREEGLEDSI